MKRAIYLAYGVFAYVVFLIAFLYAFGFVENLWVPKQIDTGPTAPLPIALFFNLGLLGLFAVSHSVMARPGFKQWWIRYVPAPIERSTFVLVASLILLALFWQWRPVAGTLWHVESPPFRAILLAISILGWAMVLYASFLIDHFDLFGLRQVWLHWQGKPYTHPPFATPWLYKKVRNPLMLGFLIAFWVTPDMTYSHLLFALAATGYILVGIALEERDLGRYLGPDYLKYRSATPMLFPFIPARNATN